MNATTNRLLLGLSESIVTKQIQFFEKIQTNQQRFQEISACTIARLAGPFDLLLMISGSQSEDIIQCATISKEMGYVRDWRFDKVSIDPETDCFDVVCSEIIQVVRDLINEQDEALWKITIDMTGELQSQLAMLAAVKFLSSFYQIEIERVLRVEYSQIGAIANLVDMTRIIKFMSWIEASSRFIEYGRAEELVHLIDGLKATVSYSEATTGALDRLGEALRKSIHTEERSDGYLYPISNEIHRQFERAYNIGAFDNLLKLVIDEIISGHIKE